MQDDTVACTIYFNSAYNFYFDPLSLLSSASLTGDLSCCFLYGEETNLRYSSNPVHQLMIHSSSVGHPQDLIWISPAVLSPCCLDPLLHCLFFSAPFKGTNLVLQTVFVSIGLTWEKQILVCSACCWVYQKEGDLGMKIWNVLICPCQDCVIPSLQSVSDEFHLKWSSGSRQKLRYLWCIKE